MIGIKANKANATLIESEKLTSGRVGLPIYFEFSTEWDGLVVTAVFKAGNVSIKKVLTVTNHRAETEVPWEVLVTPRVNLVVGLKGVKTNSQTGVTETVIPTIYCGCGDTIEFGTDDNNASNTAPVTATDKQQMMSAMETAVSNIIVEADVTVGSHSASEGNPSGTATLSATGGGKKLTLALDYIKGLKGDPTESIDDSKTDTSHTWSSAKLNTALNKKADIAEIAYVDEKFKWFHELMNGQEFDTTRREETAYSITAPNGAKAVEIEKICGKSYAFNQLVSELTVNASASGVATIDSNGALVNGTLTSSTNILYTLPTTLTTILGHKYLITTKVSNYDGSVAMSVRPFVNSSITTIGVSQNITGNGVHGVFFTVERGKENLSLRGCIRGGAGTYNNVRIENIMLFDLTAMGLDSITTIAEFKSLFPKDYYPYGNSIIDAKVRRIEVKGANGTVTTTEPIPTALQTYLADKAYGASAGTVYNELDIENKKYVQRVGSVDLGSLTWSKGGSSDDWYFWAIMPNLIKRTTSAYVKANMLASGGYNIATQAAWTSAKPCICYFYTSSSDAESRLLLANTSYSTAMDLKTSLNGTMLNYELAEPVEYDISEYIHSFDPMMTVEAGGTITYKQVNDDVHIPIKNTVEYAIKLSEVTT